MFGFLNINKPKNITSHDVISYLRKITKEKQIGHSGTLDPFATGVLPVAVGKATRLIEYLKDDKEYLATVCFGKNTDTYDCDGETTFKSNLKVQEKDVIKELENFKGEIEQIPPLYSAIKINGKKLYEYAREGKTVELTPRKVFIEEISMKNFNFETQQADILIKCSKGTYIRSIAYDLGKNLKCGAYLLNLKRTQAGNFLINKSISLYDIKTLDDVKNNLLPPPINLPILKLNETEQKKISTGQFLKNNYNFNEDEKILLTYNNNISAIAQVKDKLIKAVKVFNL